jgi:mannose-1-phosphate guanylyltransferase/phosphomannomutase
LLVLLDLVCSAHPGRTVVVPVSASRLCEEIARRHGGRVVRTKRGGAAVMAAAAQESAVFAGTEDGAYMFPDFLPAFDGLTAFLNVLELIAAHDADLRERAASAPEPHLVHRTVPTPWERKGAVMRHVAERTADHRIEDTDGLKVFHDGDWALVIPDPEDPVTHVWAEGETTDEAEQWAGRYVALVEEALD